MDFPFGAETRIDPQEKHEGRKFADLAAQAKEKMEKNGQRDGGKSAMPSRDKREEKA